MTKDQIKAIAEKIVDGDTLHINGYELKPEVTVPIIEDAIEQLLKRYCIVEREKVMSMYKRNFVKYPSVCEENSLTIIDTLEFLFGTSMFKQNKAEYTEQCETCMRKLAGEVLEVCKDATDENRHCQWNVGKDFCAYKIFWDRYTEAHWQTILTPEQFAKAKSLNQDEE